MRSSRIETVILASLVLIFAVIYALIGLFRHWHFATNAFDLGIFDQAIWHASRFESPASTVTGHHTILGDHFSPMVLTLVPLYWVLPRPETLIVAQALLFALSILPVFLFLRRRLDATPAFLLCGAYGLFWGLQRASSFDVHEIAFAPVFIALAILAIDQRRWPLFWTMALAIALVKEDLIVVLAFFAIYLVTIGERRRGALLFVASVIAFVVVVGWLLPTLSATGRFDHAASFRGVLMQPWRLPFLLVTPPAKVVTALMWVAPFAFLPVFSPLVCLILPFVLTRLLSETAAHWSMTFHYSAPLAPIVAMAAADGLSRFADRVELERSRQRLVTGLAASCLVLSLFLPGNQPFWDLFKREHYRTLSRDAMARRALALIPPDASVVAQSAIVPHISQRRDVYVLSPGAPEADIVVAAITVSPYPNKTTAEIEALIQERRARGYVVVFEEAGWIVLRRDPPRGARQGQLDDHHQ